MRMLHSIKHYRYQIGITGLPVSIERQSIAPKLPLPKLSIALFPLHSPKKTRSYGKKLFSIASFVFPVSLHSIHATFDRETNVSHSIYSASTFSIPFKTHSLFSPFTFPYKRTSVFSHAGTITINMSASVVEANNRVICNPMRSIRHGINGGFASKQLQ